MINANAMTYTLSEQNYLKAIYKEIDKGKNSVSTNDLALYMRSKPASITDMVQKLAEKKLVNYTKYHGVQLTKKGKLEASNVIRRHRLWECFLVDKLQMNWDDVHDIAEELEHIHSEEMIDRLDIFLGLPKYDPHGDPIPDKHGVFPDSPPCKILSSLSANGTGTIFGVSDDHSGLLAYMTEKNLIPGSRITVSRKFDFDNSMEIVSGMNALVLSEKACSNILIKLDNE